MNICRYLNDKDNDPDDNEDNVSVQCLKHVVFSSDPSADDFIEECHHDECIEDHREVLSGIHTEVQVTTAVNVAKILT